MSSQWKQFLELYAEKNQHLSHKQVLQMAKKPFQQLKQYYKQQGGKNLESIPICEEQITLDMLGDDEEEDKMLLEREYFSDDDDQFFEELENIIEADCRAVVLNGKDILYNSYDKTRSNEEIQEDKIMRKNLIEDIYTILIEDLIAPPAEDFFFDIYLFPNEWQHGGRVEFGPRKYHIEYDANTKKFNVSIFTKSKDSF
jgi:hypothetical protein